MVAGKGKGTQAGARKGGAAITRQGGNWGRGARGQALGNGYRQSGNGNHQRTTRGQQGMSVNGTKRGQRTTNRTVTP